MVGRRLLRDVQRERRLPEARTCGDDHEVRRLQPARQVVEVDEARRHAGDVRTAFLQRLDVLELLVQQVADVREVVAEPLLGDGEDELLDLVDDVVGVVGRLERHRRRLLRRLDEPAEQRRLLDDARVVGRVARRGDRADEVEDVRLAADLLDLARPAQLLGHGDRVDRLAASEQGHDGLEDPAVGRLVEVVRTDLLEDVRDRRLGQQHRAEDGLLGLDRVRRNAMPAAC